MFCDNSEVPNKPAFYRNLTQDLGPGMDKLQLTGRFIRLWTMMYHRHMVLLWLEKTGGKANMQCVMACDEQPASKVIAHPCLWQKQKLLKCDDLARGTACHFWKSVTLPMHENNCKH